MALRPLVALLLLVVCSACASAHRVRLDTGQGAPFEFRPTASSRSVEVSEGAFEQALE